MVATLYDTDEVFSPADSQAGPFAAGLTASVYRYQEIVAPALYIEGDFPVIADDDGTYVQRMRGYGSQADGAALGNQDGAADTQ